MSTLEKRITLLEAAMPKKDKVRTIVLLNGGRKSEVQRLSTTDRRWKREPSETEDEFFQRASREVTRNSERIALLTQDNDEAG